MTPAQIQALLDQLAANLSGPASQAFQLVFQRIIVESIIGICGGICTLLATAVFWLGFWLVYRHVANQQRAAKEAFVPVDRYDKYREDDWRFSFGMIGSIAALVSVMTIGLAAYTVLNAVTDLLTPQYAALARLLSEVHP